MKITNTKNNITGNIDIAVGEKKGTDSVGENFSSRFRKAASDNHREKISNLLDQISSQADKLSQKVDIREIKHYKRLVSEFLDETVNGSHVFSKENKLDRRGRHRVYAIIKRINQNLEDLTQEVLKEEKDNLLIVQKLDDIRGLLLDVST